MEQVFATLKEVLHGLDVAPTAQAALVLAAWPEAAGEMLHDRTRAVEYANGRLVIEVQDATWKRNLEYLAPQILAKLNRKIEPSGVDLIDFRVAKRARQEKRPGAKPVTIADIPPSLTIAADSIEDAALRERFLSAAAAYLEHSK